jgi:hypothetical protein
MVARNGALLEVGFIRAVDGEVVILHAMPVRESSSERER